MWSISKDTARIPFRSLIDLNQESVITNSYTIVIYLDLLAQHISTIILTIKDQFHEMSTRCPVKVAPLTHSQCQIVADHRLVRVVGKQYP